MISKLTDFYYNIKYFFKNLYVFRKTLWRHRCWDYTGCYHALRDSLNDMHGYQSEVNHFVSINRDKTCKEILSCVLLLDRLIEDDYLKGDYKLEAGGIIYTPPVGGLPTYKGNLKRSVDYMEQQDLELLTKILNKHLRRFWH